MKTHKKTAVVGESSDAGGSKDAAGKGKGRDVREQGESAEQESGEDEGDGRDEDADVAATGHGVVSRLDVGIRHGALRTPCRRYAPVDGAGFASRIVVRAAAIVEP